MLKKIDQNMWWVKFNIIVLKISNSICSNKYKKIIIRILEYILIYDYENSAVSSTECL